MSERIQHRLGVSATREQIWEVIADLPGWAAWNPLYPKAEGSIAFGAALRLTEQATGQPARVLDFKVTDWAPGEHLYLRSPAGFMTTRLQYVEIEGLADTGCVVAAGVIFNGLLEAARAKKNRFLRQGFVTMLEGLKVRVEGAV